MELSEKAVEGIKTFRKTQAAWERQVRKPMAEFSSEDCYAAEKEYTAAKLDLCLTVAIENDFFAEEVG